MRARKMADRVIEVIDFNSEALSKAVTMLKSTNAKPEWISDFDGVQSRNSSIKEQTLIEIFNLENPGEVAETAEPGGSLRNGACR